ncbi:MAG: hypothetical protein FWH37_01955 [Candidatus Bathyarchaeota archaeon]|nr:hypothetical protein [Candidatus Termiticorpusculum sp.]
MVKCKNYSPKRNVKNSKAMKNGLLPKVKTLNSFRLSELLFYLDLYKM